MVPSEALDHGVIGTTDDDRPVIGLADNLPYALLPDGSFDRIAEQHLDHVDRGRYAAIECTVDGRCGLAIHHRNGVLTLPADQQLPRAGFSPDDSRVALLGTTSDGNSRLQIVELATGAVTLDFELRSAGRRTPPASRAGARMAATSCSPREPSCSSSSRGPGRC